MALNPQDKSSGSKIGLPAEGTVPARLVRIVEIGKHTSEKYGQKDQVQLYYTLPTRIIEDEGDFQGKQHMIRSKRMTKSSNEKAALMEHVNAINPGATSLEQLIDQPCYLTIKHNEYEGNTYANIISVMPVPEGMTVDPSDTEPYYFDWDNPDAEVWQDRLSEWQRDVIQEADNYVGSPVEQMVMRLEAGA